MRVQVSILFAPSRMVWTVWTHHGFLDVGRVRLSVLLSDGIARGLVAD